MDKPVFRYIPFLVFAFTLCVAGESLVTDRPDQTESSSTVGFQRIQFELGYTHSVDDEADTVRTDSLSQTLIRYGLIEGLELRFGWDGYQWQETTSGGATTRIDGASDVAAGLKYRLRAEQGWMPETAFLTHLSVPVGKAGLSSEQIDPDLRFAFSHTLNDTYSFGYNLGTAWTTGEDATGKISQRNHFIYTVALGAGITDELGAFVEFYGDVPTQSNSTGPANSFDGGLTYLLSDDMQLDISSGIGLSDAADDWFVSAGIAFRLPN
ncbi:MAG: transporter [Planctomycetes bacterium]|nr:transporter [Planctomycetota bacterium]